MRLLDWQNHISYDASVIFFLSEDTSTVFSFPFTSFSPISHYQSVCLLSPPHQTSRLVLSEPWSFIFWIKVAAASILSCTHKNYYSPILLVTFALILDQYQPFLSQFRDISIKKKKKMKFVFIVNLFAVYPIITSLFLCIRHM